MRQIACGRPIMALIAAHRLADELLGRADDAAKDSNVDRARTLHWDLGPMIDRATARLRESSEG